MSLCAALAVSVIFGACGFEHASSVLAPSTTTSSGSTVTPASGATSSNSPSLVGIWTSQSTTPSAAATPTLPSASSCGNFQYQIASQTASAIAGTFTAICGNGLTISASANGHVDGTNVALTLDGSGSMPGVPNCNFNVTSTGQIQDNGNTLYLPYSGTTCLGPVHGTEVLHKPQPAQAPAPPAPDPVPPPPAPSGPSDGLDLHSAVITGGSPADVASWPITTQITAMDFQNGVQVTFSKKDGAGRWPDVVPPGWDGPLQYTLWMVVNIGGRWYTSGGVEYWYGLQYSGGPANEFAYNWYYEPLVWGPLANHQPANGEQVGFFVTSGDQRVKDASRIHERSNVVVMPFPSGGGYFPFSGGVRTK
ncbi:MAG TPA: hypothetical protein VFA59_11145 [Vicinamibacterales bacterium]|nr:hypothetical protein [Vicinamibacterales bacterium]